MLQQEALVVAVECIQHLTSSFQPTAGIILGSGLSGLTRAITDPIRIPFGDIPNFASSTAKGHRGELVFGTLAGKPVVAMAGRFHRYEGWTFDQVTFPVEVISMLGARNLIVSNAAGGLRHHFHVGDVMLIRDHINFLPARESAQPFALRGTSPYDPHMAETALRCGREHNFSVHQGTYLATLGPSYETRAEYRMMRRLGADCVGMSTVPEVLVAQRCGMRVLALSMISNVARPDAPQGSASETTHAEVLEAGRNAEPNMSRIVESVVRSLVP